MQQPNDQELDEPQIMNVKIVNRNDFPISDRFDGVPYVFETNHPVSVPIDAANHIFGWFPGVEKEVVRRHCQKRFGWNTPSMVQEGQHNRFFDAIEITAILYRMVAVEVDDQVDDQEAEPESPAKGRAPKTNRLMQSANTAVA